MRPRLVPRRTVPMRSHSPRTRAIAAALAALALGGCAGTGGPLGARRTTMGTLKADVARLESQNQQFRRQVAELEADKHRINEQLAQEREANGDLAARLDNARMLLARQGVSTETTEPRRPTDSIERITPPANRARSSRKPPFAQIGGGARPLPTPDDEDIPLPEEPDRDDPEPAGRESSRAEPTLRWLPVETGLSEPTVRRR